MQTLGQQALFFDQAECQGAVADRLEEDDDAVAVVVSEETGKISVSLDGQIERGLTPEALRERLRRLIQGRRA